ncbi:hypothetical protein PV08_06204 [Exophiala spinifera]|uniref:Mid2 domain-containing protein n=1 Tax=Exophiala spinifera TaxID=91928 RepID=A0A0D2BAY8_9EURO|nr:uncharacterized protein PV08_06204 [Exophiala spinifera]KIW16153.1 hypothetical protein PV08_06204 [Exophiala spinifera]
MERPAKRMRISNPEVRNPRDTGSRMTEGLFTSELGIRSDDSDEPVHATRTISLSDFQRRNIYGEYQRVPRQVLPRGDQGIYLRPRAPDATVTASVVEINVNDGTSVSKVTEITAAPSGTVVSLSNMGTAAVSLTVPGNEATDSSNTASETSTSTTDDPSSTSSSTTSGTVEVTTTSTGSSTTASTTGSIIPNGPTNGTTTSATITELTVTVTATSTYEISLINGTFITPNVTAFVTATDYSQTGLITDIDTATTSATFTFGDLTSTPSPTYSSDYFDSGAASTGYLPGGIVQTGSPTETSGSASSSSPSSKSDSGGDGPGLSPTQQQVVGGVVGGIAGIAVALAILLVVLRWYRRRLKARGQLPEQIAARQLGSDSDNRYPMSMRSSNTPFTAAVAHNLRRLRPHSLQTNATTATGGTDFSAKDSERGFQRIAGRKIAPVLSSGGDPYGGNYGAFEKEAEAGPSDPLHGAERSLAGASFYRDHDGFYGGKGNHSPTFPPSPTTAASGGKAGELPFGLAGLGSTVRDFAGTIGSDSQTSLNAPSRPEGIAVMRPSPARTPVTLSPAASSIRLPIQPPPTLDEDAPPLPTGLNIPGQMQRDGVGRSLASQDGSHISRSSGRSGTRFVENI